MENKLDKKKCEKIMVFKIHGTEKKKIEKKGRGENMEMLNIMITKAEMHIYFFFTIEYK